MDNGISRVGLDSSVVIAILSKDSSDYLPSVSAIERLRAARAEFILTEHAILESFSVLSRSPKPVGLVRGAAEALLRQSFFDMPIAPIRPGLAWDTIQHTLACGFHGGRVYDAIIALATHEAGATLLLTWNVRHFRSIAPHGLEIKTPAEIV